MGMSVGMAELGQVIDSRVEAGLRRAGGANPLPTISTSTTRPPMLPVYPGIPAPAEGAYSQGRTYPMTMLPTPTPGPGGAHPSGSMIVPMLPPSRNNPSHHTSGTPTIRFLSSEHPSILCGNSSTTDGDSSDSHTRYPTIL